MSTTKHVLIAGAGIAGPSLALLLTRAGIRCTIVERAPAFRTTGQQIDLAGNGFKVAQFMDIMDDVYQHTVHDDGIKFVTNDNNTIATFPVNSAGPGEW